MSYIPFEPRVFPIFIYYIFIAVFALIVTLKMFSKYYKKKHPAALYLSLVFTVLTLSIIVLALGLGEAIITGYYKEVYRFSLPFAYSMVLLADFFLFKFANQLTNKGRKAFIPLFFICILLIIVLFLPWNYWGIPSEEIGQPYIRLYTTMGIVFYSATIYISIIIMCQITKKYSDSKVNKARLSFLSYSMLSLLLFFIMLIGDTILIVVYNDPGYSIFVYIAWIFALIFLILAYLSLFMPKRMLNRLEK